MAAISRIGQLLLRQNASILRPSAGAARLISTSKKSGETATVTEKLPQVGSIDEAAAAGKKKWFSYGFSKTDEAEDLATLHSVMFFTVTLVLVGSTYLYMYAPDTRLRDWATREAYFELQRREALGLPHVDPNYADPATIELPTDGELESTEIII